MPCLHLLRLRPSINVTLDVPAPLVTQAPAEREPILDAEILINVAFLLLLHAGV